MAGASATVPTRQTHGSGARISSGACKFECRHKWLADGTFQAEATEFQADPEFISHRPPPSPALCHPRRAWLVHACWGASQRRHLVVLRDHANHRHCQILVLQRRFTNSHAEGRGPGIVRLGGWHHRVMMHCPFPAASSFLVYREGNRRDQLLLLFGITVPVEKTCEHIRYGGRGSFAPCSTVSSDCNPMINQCVWLLLSQKGLQPDPRQGQQSPRRVPSPSRWQRRC